MCNIVVINKGEKEITTPREFLNYFHFMPDEMFYFNSQGMDECLCDCDIEKELTKNNIDFIEDCGDIYVTT